MPELSRPLLCDIFLDVPRKGRASQLWINAKKLILWSAAKHDAQTVEPALGNSEIVIGRNMPSQCLDSKARISSGHGLCDQMPDT
jgi:hypothetical protein